MPQSSGLRRWSKNSFDHGPVPIETKFQQCCCSRGKIVPRFVVLVRFVVVRFLICGLSVFDFFLVPHVLANLAFLAFDL